MKKILKKLALISTVVLLSVGGSNTKTVKAETNTTTVVYNHKTLDFGDKKVVSKDGSVYIPLRALSEQLYFEVYWKLENNTVRVYDDLNDVYLSTDGQAKINGKETTSEKVPLTVNGSIYVPLRFVSEALGIDVAYDQKSKTVTMKGRDIYDISQKDLNKPYLITYTKDGRKVSGLIERNFLLDNPTDFNKTKIWEVRRTKYGDMVTASYDYVGASHWTIQSYLYVQNGNIIGSGNVKTSGYDTSSSSNGVEALPTKAYDDRIVLLKEDKNYNRVLSVYDEKTGKVVYTIDGKNFKYGIDNVQGVGKNFLVLGFIVPNETEGLHYETSVLNLETNELINVAEYLPGKNVYLEGDTDSLVLNRDFGITSNNGVYFKSRTGEDTLNFVGKRYVDGELINEACEIKLETK